MKRPAWYGDWPVPKAVHLPGVRVRVRQLPETDMLEKYGTRFGCFSYDVPKQLAVVILNGDLPLEVQRYTLLHELQHALVDVLDQMVEKFPESVQPWAMHSLQNLKVAEMVAEKEEVEATDAPA